MMPTILSDDGERTVASTSALSAGDVLAVTGYELKPQGLCRDDICVPAPGLDAAAGIDIGAVAALLRRPLAVDEVTGDVALAAPVDGRDASIVGQSIADLVLRDLDGNAIAWSTIGRKKKVMVTWASW